MERSQIELHGDTVKKSNEMARAGWPVESVLEPRIVALVASCVRVTDKEFSEYEIPSREVIEGGNGEDYAMLRKACLRLVKTTLEISDQDGSGWSMYSLLSKCRYDPKRRLLIARFDPDMKAHYLDLGKRFTKYSLSEFLSLPTIYSQRIFEILKSWDDRPEKEISLADLFKMLVVPLSMQRYPDFRRKVLESAHKYIHEHTSLKYEWEPIKKGRAVASIRFIFRRGPKAEAVAEKAATRTSSAKNKAFIAAVNCWEACKGVCEPKKNAQCKICARFVRK